MKIVKFEGTLTGDKLTEVRETREGVSYCGGRETCNCNSCRFIGTRRIVEFRGQLLTADKMTRAERAVVEREDSNNLNWYRTDGDNLVSVQGGLAYPEIGLYRLTKTSVRRGAGRRSDLRIVLAP